jgi:hypothetical protein
MEKEVFIYKLWLKKTPSRKKERKQIQNLIKIKKRKRPKNWLAKNKNQSKKSPKKTT